MKDVFVDDGYQICKCNSAEECHNFVGFNTNWCIATNDIDAQFWFDFHIKQQNAVLFVCKKLIPLQDNKDYLAIIKTSTNTQIVDMNDNELRLSDIHINWNNVNFKL